MRFEDDSLESAKNVKQWNVKIISVSTLHFFLYLLYESSSVVDCYWSVLVYLVFMF